MDPKLEAKIARVQKLMEEAATQGEAEAAARAFQRLLARHNLSEAEVSGFSADLEPGYVHQLVRVAKDGPGVTWRVQLIYTLAKFNFCQVVRTNTGRTGTGRGRNGKGGGVVHLIGQPANVAAVKSLFNVMAPRVTFLAEDAYDQMLLTWVKGHKVIANLAKEFLPNRRAWTNSWLRGFPDGLWKKLEEERRQETADPTFANLSALVVVKDAAITRAVEDLVGPTRGSTGYNASDRSAYRSGYRAGESWSDPRAVGATTTRAVKG